MYLDDVMQALYASEINCSVSTFWDGGYEWKLGDEMNGFLAEGNEKTPSLVAVRLHQAAVQYYPDSLYARTRS